MKIILDGVFNHCGSFNKWMDRERIYENQEGYEKGAYVAKDSPYHSYFKFFNEHSWPYNEFYDGWWGHNTLPKLNYEASPELVADIMRVARKWVSPPLLRGQAGVWTWRRIWDIRRNSTIISGRNSAGMSERPIRTR